MAKVNEDVHCSSQGLLFILFVWFYVSSVVNPTVLHLKCYILHIHLVQFTAIVQACEKKLIL